MARIDVKNGFSFTFANINLNGIYEAVDYVASSTVFQARYGGGSNDTFRGSGFSYDALGEPTGGVVTSYQATLTGRVIFTVAGVAAPATSLVAAARTAGNGDDIALMRSFLGEADAFNGSSGNDSFSSYGGNDRLIGGAGDDRLDGGAGDDLLIGGQDLDLLTGGTGRDTFRMDRASDSAEFARDTIRDFKPGIDKIDLSRIDANQSAPGNQAFKFIGGAEFSGRPGELRFMSRSVLGDVDGDGNADLAINLRASSLSASDFLL